MKDYTYTSLRSVHVDDEMSWVARVQCIRLVHDCCTRASSVSPKSRFAPLAKVDDE